MDSEPIVFQPRKRRPGLHSIAKQLGVSHTTVSKALRGDPSLSEKVRQNVIDVARREGYFPSTILQGLVSGRSGTIGIVIPTFDSQFVGQLANAMATTLWEAGVIPMTLCSDLQVDREEKMLAALAQKRVDGLIIMPSREDREDNHFCDLLTRHTPIVGIDTALPRIEAPLVASDDERGGFEATSHLIRNGHRRILHLACALDNACSDRRREMGYRRAMEEAGLQPQVIYVEERRPDTRKVVAQIQAFLTSTDGKKMTAVFAFNDYPLAYCVYVAAVREGRVVGQDLALIGYGNFRGAPINMGNDDPLQPWLSTVEQHPAQTGSAAAKILLSMMDHKPVPRETLVQPTVMERPSSAVPQG